MPHKKKRLSGDPMSENFMGPLTDRQRGQKKAFELQKKQFSTPRQASAPPKQQKPDTNPFSLGKRLREAAGTEKKKNRR